MGQRAKAGQHQTAGCESPFERYSFLKHAAAALGGGGFQGKVDFGNWESKNSSLKLFVSSFLLY